VQHAGADTHQQQQQSGNERPRSISGEVGAANPGIIDDVRTAVSTMFPSTCNYPLSSFRLPACLWPYSLQFGLKLKGWTVFQERIRPPGPPTEAAKAQLFPLRTTGDGRCLDHALMVAQYGVHADDDTGLREEVLKGTLGDPEFQKFAKARLLEQCRLQNTLFDSAGQLDDGGVYLAAELEWDDNVRQANTKSGHLGKLAIFAYANAFRRPIVVVGAQQGGDNGECLLGVFLPLFHSPHRCSKEPLALDYNGADHFTAIVFPPGSGGNDRLLTLHDTNLMPFPVSFLLDGEVESELKSRYLNISTYKTETGDINYAVVSNDSVIPETKKMVTFLKNLRNPGHLGSIGGRGGTSGAASTPQFAPGHGGCGFGPPLHAHGSHQHGGPSSWGQGCDSGEGGGGGYGQQGGLHRALRQSYSPSSS